MSHAKNIKNSAPEIAGGTKAKVSRKQRETILEVERQILKLERVIISMEKTIIKKLDKKKKWKNKN